MPGCALFSGPTAANCGFVFHRLFPIALCLAFCTGIARAADDITEKTEVLVPDGILGSMRKVDSETLILPNASAVMRQQQQRTAARELRERAAQRAEAAPLSAVTGTQTTASTPAAAADDPEATLVEESVQAVAAVEEPSTAVAEPAPATPEPEPEPGPAEDVSSEQE
jgi:hypothetical protein